jgi:hypothetical protein
VLVLLLLPVLVLLLLLLLCPLLQRHVQQMHRPPVL